jgi:hypothetical protein
MADERFWSKVEPTGFCWNWTASLKGGGYGQYWNDARNNVYAHRHAYELLVGPIPKGLVLDHLCRNPSCVNPDHLEPVVQGENIRRGFSGLAKRASALECPNGHPYDGKNTGWRTTGHRRCRACNAAHARRYRSARRPVVQ